MAYIDSLQKVSIQVDGVSVECVAASFKGVPFFFESADFSGGGRNVQTSNIPFSNDHANEDIGKNVESFSFNIYFVGEDAEKQKDDFLRVCNEAGAGELVHPHFGVFRVRVKGGVSLSYNNKLEFISGSVTFVPENDFEIRNTVVSLSGKTRSKAVELRKSVADNAAKKISIAGKAKQVVDKTVDMSYKAVDAVYAARSSVQKTTEFVKEIGRIKSNMRTILLSPGDFAARVQNLIVMTGEILGIETDPKDNVVNGAALMGFSLAASRVYDVQSLANRSAIEGLTRLTAAAMVAENLVDCEFSSVSEAEHYQDIVYDAFENLLSEIDDADFYVQAQSLEAAALKFLRDSLSKIPYEVDIDVPETNNLLSLVYGVYGDVERIEDVFERNGYRDPLFVNPSDRVRVLCDD